MKKLIQILAVAAVLLVSACSIPRVENSKTPTALATPRVSTQRLGSAGDTPQPGVTPITPLPAEQSAPAAFTDFFGVETGSLTPDFSLMKNLGVSWLRYNAVVWSNFEATEGQYNWDSLLSLDEMLRQASSQGIKVILIVRGTPAWAQKVQGSFCGPVLEEKLPAYAAFLSAIVSRYSAPPFNVHTFELGNEPDVGPIKLPEGSIFGCYGDPDDALFGGGYYAEMVKIATLAIRQADPQAQILSGGLLLDCDPASPGQPGYCKEGSQQPPKFYQGFMQNGGGEAVDYLAFHSYVYYGPGIAGVFYLETQSPNWQASGGAVMGKVKYLRDQLAQTGLDKPLFQTEVSFLCYPDSDGCNPPGEDFFRKQAEYGAALVVRNYVERIRTIWYLFEGPGWRSGGLLDESQNPKPVFWSIRYALTRLRDSQVVRQVNDSPDLMGYEFKGPAGHFYFLAPTGTQPSAFQLPAGAQKAIDVYGNEVPFDQLGQLNSPIYIELAP